MKPTSITVTGTTTQGAVASPSRMASEFTTGELTTVQEITVEWPSQPSADDLLAFEATLYGSPAYAPTHVSTPGTARYWRVLALEADDATTITVGEIQMRETSGGADLTSTTFAIAGATDSGTAQQAFDNSVAVGWGILKSRDPSLWWIGQDFGDGNAKEIVEITIRTLAGATTTPRAFNVQQSPDGTTWTTVWSVTGEPVWTSGETRTFTRPA